MDDHPCQNKLRVNARVLFWQKCKLRIAFNECFNSYKLISIMSSTKNDRKLEQTIRYCLCGREDKTVNIDMAKYRQAKWRTPVGMLLGIVGVIYIFSGAVEMSAYIWFCVVLLIVAFAYLVFQYLKNIIRGHGLLCAARIAVITFSKML